MRDGSVVEDRIRLGQRAVAGVVDERFPHLPVADRRNGSRGSTWPSSTKSALGKTIFKFGQGHFEARPTSAKKISKSFLTPAFLLSRNLWKMSSTEKQFSVNRGASKSTISISPEFVEFGTVTPITQNGSRRSLLKGA